MNGAGIAAKLPAFMGRELQLDVRGKACPVPVLELARAVRTLTDGDVVAVQADDPAARADIAAWCDMTGHRLLDLNPEGAEVRARVQKSSATRVASPA